MTNPKPGRKDAYMLRARARYLRAAEEVIATTGPDATIEQFALHADVAIATLYKHFGSKEGLIKAAMLDAAQKWEAWQFDVLSHVSDPLEHLALGLRLAHRICVTHPTIAVVLLRGRAAGYFEPRDMGLRFFDHARALADAGIISGDDLELRCQCVVSAVAAEGARQIVGGADPADGDKVVELVLPLLGITPAKAKALAHAELPELPLPVR
jgi:AcrR family transcriptional regulator